MRGSRSVAGGNKAASDSVVRAMNEDVIQWLRSPEGEQWSRQRIRMARRQDGSLSPASYASRQYRRNLVSAPGFFSVREG